MLETVQIPNKQTDTPHSPSSPPAFVPCCCSPRPPTRSFSVQISLRFFVPGADLAVAAQRLLAAV